MVEIVERQKSALGVFTHEFRISDEIVTTKELASAVESITLNATTTTSRCDLEPQNPWCGQFGAQQYIEVAYLTIITIFGVLGNLVVIFSIILEGKILKQANVFIVNLALADFLVRKILYPTFF